MVAGFLSFEFTKIHVLILNVWVAICCSAHFNITVLVVIAEVYCFFISFFNLWTLSLSVCLSSHWIASTWWSLLNWLIIKINYLKNFILFLIIYVADICDLHLVHFPPLMCLSNHSPLLEQKRERKTNEEIKKCSKEESHCKSYIKKRAVCWESFEEWE